MVILNYKKKYHTQIITACAHALRAGKIVAYPTDTSYGLACDISNRKALNNFFKIKERSANKPVHIVVPSVSYAKSVTVWNKRAGKLAKAFWPGPLTLVLNLKQKTSSLKNSLRKFTAGTGTLGLRMPKNNIALDLVKQLGHPIPATSANPSGHKSGGYDSYSAEDILVQFENKKHKPDIILNAGKLPRKLPSTLVKITSEGFEILRAGPVSEIQIKKILT